MKFAGRIAIVGMLVSMTCAQTKKSDGSPDISPAKLERMPESLEVRYALSAAPRICAMVRQHTSWIRPRDISLITQAQTALAASLCAATGSGPTSRSETILLGRLASTAKAQRHCYKTIFTPPN